MLCVVTTAFNSSYGPRLIVWPPVRQFLAHVAEIVARLIRNRRLIFSINRGARVISFPLPHSSTSVASFLLRRALRLCSELSAAVPLHHDGILVAVPPPASRRRATNHSPPPRHRSFAAVPSPVSSNLTRHGRALGSSCCSCCFCSCLDVESRPHDYRGGLRCN